MVMAASAEGVSSRVATLAGAITTGASFTDCTVRTKLVLAEPPLVSVTETVMVADPEALVAGISCNKRTAPEPLIDRPACGTRFVFEELAVISRLGRGVSASSTLNGTVMGSSSRVVAFAMPPMLGGESTGRTSIVKLRDTE